MNKNVVRILAAISLFALVLSLISYAFAEPPARNDPDIAYPSQYDKIFDLYENVHKVNWYDEYNASWIEKLNLPPKLARLTPDDRQVIGYYLEDINNDGTPELFIGLDTVGYTRPLLQAYTIKDKEAYCFYSADDWNLYLAKDGSLIKTSRDHNGTPSDYFSQCYLSDDDVMVEGDGVYCEETGIMKGVYRILQGRIRYQTAKPLEEEEYDQNVLRMVALHKYVRFNTFGSNQE